MPRVTISLALSWSRRPRLRAMTTLMPTPSPMEQAHIRLVMGKDRDTAVSAFSLSWATKALSTKL